MTRLGIIGGTNASVGDVDLEAAVVATAYGACVVETGTIAGAKVAFVRRHRAGHELLSSAVTHRANVRALADIGVDAIVATTVCGIIDPRIALGVPILFDDLHFPDNRLPDGSPCTFFDEPGDPDRGHLIAPTPFSPALRVQLLDAAARAGVEVRDGGTYIHALGPRFNTKAEIAHFAACGGTAVSQTAGPEAVLAGELEIPYCLLGFGVDYANGVTADPTPAEILGANVERSKGVFAAVLTELATGFRPMGFDTGFIYRMGR
ncbi:MAG: MTAP family purine nucleoside phosphorylase [Coriobacteriia bacterium]|nr:MTAP family purine nucleoside phosphorylase [Coriobacteriia bacterium]